MALPMETEPTIPADLPDRVGAIIRALLGAKRMSIRELAARTGLPENTLRDHINGHGPGVTAADLVKIGPILKITASEVYAAAESPRFPLPTKGEFTLLEGLPPDETHPLQAELPFRASLTSVR